MHPAMLILCYILSLNRKSDKTLAAMFILIYILTLPTSQAQLHNDTSQQTEERPLNDHAARHRLRSPLAIHHATAYEYLGNPTQATQIIWLHLPMDINAALNAPYTMLKLAHNLQDTCDAAYLALFNDPRTGLNSTRNTLQMAIKQHRQKRPATSKKRNEETTFKYLKEYRAQSLEMARMYCQKHNMRLTQPANPNLEYRRKLAQFLTLNSINEAIIDKKFGFTDSLNRLPPIASIPSEAFYKNRNDMAMQYNAEQRTFVPTGHGLKYYDDDKDAIYTYNRHGDLRVYFATTDGDYTLELLKKQGIADTEIASRNYLRKTPVVCEVLNTDAQTTTTPNKAEQSSAKEGSNTYMTTIQTCYHTVEHIEVEAVIADMHMSTMWQQHNLIVDTQGDTAKELINRRETTTTSEDDDDNNKSWQTDKMAEILRDEPPREHNNRTKRFVGLIVKGLASLITSGVSRKFAKQMLPLIGLNKIKKIAPESRKAFKMISKLKNVPVALPALVGMAGLGYAGWSNYKSNKKFSEQRKSLIKSREHLNRQSTTLQTLTMQTSANTEDIKEINMEMLTVQTEFEQIKILVHKLDRAASLQNTISQVRMKNDEIRDTANINIAEISETLISVRANVVPGVFTPILRKGAAQLGIEGNQLLPNPENPVSLSPLISNGRLDLYANFLAGTDKWEMYRVIPIPKFRDNIAYTRKTDFEYALVGLAQERYIALDTDEARACKRGACKTTGVIRFLADDPCTIKMLALGEPKIGCKVNESPGDPFLRSTTSGLIYSVPQKITGRLHCEGADRAKIGHDGTITLEGMGVVNIPPGCALITNAPNIAKIIGPPREHNLRNNGTLIRHLGKAIAKSQDEKIKVKQTTEIKTATKITEGVKKNKAKIAGITTAITILIIASALIIIMFAGKITCIAILHRKVMRKIRKTAAATTKAKDAIEYGFHSVVRQADDLTRFLQDRTAVNRYLEGTTNVIPLQRHVSTLNIEGEVETIPLGVQQSERRETAPPKYQNPEGNATTEETSRKNSYRTANELYPDPRPQ